MKLKILFLFTIIAFGNSVFGSAIIERPTYYNHASKPSNIIKSNINTVYDNETLNVAIKELNEKLRKTPDNYNLNISLADLYLKTKQYDKAYNELVYLNNLDRRNKLTAKSKEELTKIFNEAKQTGLNNPKKSSLYVNLAMLCQILNEPDKSEKYLNAALTSNADQKLILNAISKIYETSDDYTNAINICDKLLSLKPSNTDIRKLKASYYLQSHDSENAIKEYGIITDNNPNDDEAKYELYKLLSSKGLPEKDIIKQIYKDRNLAESLYNLADILIKNNNITDAKKYTQMLVTKYPDDVNGYILLAEIYKKEGKLKESYEVLNKIRDKADSNEAIAKYNVLLATLSSQPLQEANSLMATGLYAQALEVLKTADQENLYVILAQARANYFLSQKQKSLDYLNKAMTLYPNNSDVFCAFAYIYHKENDLDSAEKYIKEALKINPDNKTANDLMKIVKKSQADRYVNRIISAFESQNYTEAMRLINEALQISPDYGLLYYYKGLTYIAQNNYAASTAALYKSLELDKSNITTYFYLGIAFDNLSEPSNALMYYQKFINLLPKDELGESEKLKYAKERIQKLKQ